MVFLAYIFMVHEEEKEKEEEDEEGCTSDIPLPLASILSSLDLCLHV